MSAPSSPVPYGNDGDDDYMTAEERFDIFMPVVQTLVNALGGYEQVPSENDESEFETVYRPGDSVLGVLKDLKKLWRKDDSDDERTVARCMAKAGLMKELIALVKECTPRGDWGRKVALMACELLVWRNEIDLRRPHRCFDMADRRRKGAEGDERGGSNSDRLRQFASISTGVQSKPESCSADSTGIFDSK